MKVSVKKVLVGLGVALVLLQAWRPAKNQSNEHQYDISTRFEVPAQVDQILKAACNDCHSNYTRYPWYAEIQPVGIWLDQHVRNGKKHLNFSTLTNKRIAVQNHKFEEIIEVVTDGSMPLNSYTWTHHDARLTQEQRDLLMNWAKGNMDKLKAEYPADSLILKRK